MRARGERRDDLGRHVEAGGRRRDRAGTPREHRLVALAIGLRVLALDVARQRDVADPIEQRVRIARQRDDDRAVCCAFTQEFDRGAVGDDLEERLKSVVPRGEGLLEFGCRAAEEGEHLLVVHAQGEVVEREGQGVVADVDLEHAGMRHGAADMRVDLGGEFRGAWRLARARRARGVVDTCARRWDCR